MDERTAKLLIKAIRTLPDREQDRLLAALLGESSAKPSTATRPMMLPDVVFSYPTSLPLPAPVVGAAGQSTMLPVRLPPDLHERLRVWSSGQGFSMASVVRGLVERFLDEQEGTVRARTAAGKAPAARPRTKRPTKPRARG